MVKTIFTLLVLVSAGLAQTAADGSFSVRHVTDASYSLSSAQMREAERLYQSACAVVRREFHSGAVELRPHFTVVIGTERNEVYSGRKEPGEIRMKKWDPIMFAQGSVALAFDGMLTNDVIVQLGNRAVRQTYATVDVADSTKP